jgi:hypothetical protein
VGLTAAEYRERLRAQVDLIADGDLRLTRDRYGRVHTAFTRLPRDLRCCLTVDGHPLVDTDLANCQPLLLGMLARDWLAGSRAARTRLRAMKFTDRNPYNGTHGRLSRLTSVNPSPITVTTTVANPHSNANRNPYYGYEQGVTLSAVKGLRKGGAETLPADLLESLRVLGEGKFYESLLTPEERARDKPSRDRMKLRFYRVLFGRNRGRRRFRNMLQERFRARHPTMAAVLFDLKRRNYKHSSHVLQNLEATIFIYRACGRVMRERPGCFVATLHDGVLTTPDDAGYVAGVIQDEFNKLGIKPTLKRHDYA